MRHGNKVHCGVGSTVVVKKRKAICTSKLARDSDGLVHAKKLFSLHPMSDDCLYTHETRAEDFLVLASRPCREKQSHSYPDFFFASIWCQAQDDDGNDEIVDEAKSLSGNSRVLGGYGRMRRWIEVFAAAKCRE